MKWVPGISILDKSEIPENHTVAMTSGIANHARTLEDAARMVEVNRARDTERVFLIQAMRAWNEFFWPITQKKGRFRTTEQQENLSPNPKYKPNTPEPWFVAWYRDKKIRTLINERTINPSNFKAYRDDPKAHPEESKIAWDAPEVALPIAEPEQTSVNCEGRLTTMKTGASSSASAAPAAKSSAVSKPTIWSRVKGIFRFRGR